MIRSRSRSRSVNTSFAWSSMDGSALALSSPDTLSLSLSEMEGAPCQVTETLTVTVNIMWSWWWYRWVLTTWSAGGQCWRGYRARSRDTGHRPAPGEDRKYPRYKDKDWHQVISTYFQSQWMKLSWALPILELIESIKRFHAYYDAIKTDIMSRISKFISFLIRAAVSCPI